jgi:sec-independent protein translocase protein TatA
VFRNFGTTELVIILVVVVLLFGGRKIPELVRAMGQSVKEFRRAIKEDEDRK